MESLSSFEASVAVLFFLGDVLVDGIDSESLQRVVAEATSLTRQQQLVGAAADHQFGFIGVAVLEQPARR